MHKLLFNDEISFRSYIDKMNSIIDIKKLINSKGQIGDQSQEYGIINVCANNSSFGKILFFN